MKKTFLYLSFLTFSICSCAQSKQGTDSIISSAKENSQFKLEKNIPGNFLFMDVDVLDNIYLITAANRLVKLNNNGDSVAVFNDVKKYGTPTHIDVNNPLKILLYYKNYSTVVILDRLLVFRNSINFRKLNIFRVQALATSYDNKIWLFDEQDLKLKKISDEGLLLQESSDMRQLVNPVPSPQKIIDSYNKVFLYDEKKGFYIFDYYGGLQNNIPFLHWTDIAVSGNQLMGFSGNILNSYQLNSLTLKTFEMPVYMKDYISIKAMNGKLYLLKKDGLEIYSMQ